MDIYEYLKMDHQKVSKLFKQFEKSHHSLFKAEIIEILSKELTLHVISEQEIFYKALENFPESKKIAIHGEKEHEDIINKIENILNQKNNIDKIEKKVLELKKIVEHHVKEEEGEMFRQAKRVLSDKAAYILKEKMHDYKEKLLAGLIIETKETI